MNFVAQDKKIFKQLLRSNNCALRIANCELKNGLPKQAVLFLFFYSVTVFELNLADYGNFEKTVEFIAVESDIKLNILAGKK